MMVHNNVHEQDTTRYHLKGKFIPYPCFLRLLSGIDERTTAFGTTLTKFANWQLMLTDGGELNFLALISYCSGKAGSISKETVIQLSLLHR